MAATPSPVTWIEEKRGKLWTAWLGSDYVGNVLRVHTEAGHRYRVVWHDVHLPSGVKGWGITEFLYRQTAQERIERAVAINLAEDAARRLAPTSDLLLFNELGPVTGRWSSAGPHYHNAPKTEKP